MSILGKIVTVLILIAGVAVGALMVGSAKTGEQWHRNAQLADEKRQEAVEAIEVLQAALARANTEKEQNQAVYLADLGNKQAAIAELKDEKQNLLRDRDQQGVRLEELNTKVTNLSNSYEKLNEDKERLQAAHDEAVATSVELRDANQELVKDKQNLVRENADLRTRVRGLQQRVAELTKKATWYEQNWPGGETPEAKAMLPTTALAGRIIQVDPNRSVAEINLGERDHVVEGMTLIISRGDQYLADLVITKVDENRAVGQLTTVTGEVQRSDHVTYTVRR